MNVQAGVIGSGEVGLTLAEGLIGIGYSVMVGSRDPSQQRLTRWAQQRPNASLGTLSETAAFGQLLIISTPWSGVSNAIKQSGAQNFSGKTVIDVTNPLDFSSGAPALALGFSDSAGESVQRMLPDAKVVKAFNIVGHPHMINPKFAGGPPTMFICGNDQNAKAEVAAILAKFGWDVVDIGGIEGSRLLEPLAMLWIRYYMNTGSGDHAFKMLKR